jgi:cyclohexanone monooxygenase
MSKARPQSDTSIEGTDYDVVVVGSGFAGLYALHSLREMGKSVKVLERASDVGGTWFHNRYPGARCDTESHVYCYSFSDELLNEWEYSERYPDQQEIRQYFQHVTDRFDLRKDIQFETEVTSLELDEGSGVWHVNTDQDQDIATQHVILAVGPLSEPYVPDFDGLDTYEGDLYHTATWPHEPISFENEDVGIIGTGSSGVQSIPKIAEQAEHLSVYQRTPNWIVPAQNHPLSDEDWEEIRANYDEIWEKARNTNSGHPYDSEYRSVEGLDDETVEQALEERWQEGGFLFLYTFDDLLSNETTNRRVREFIQKKIENKLDDPELADKLIPDIDDHPYAAKRPPLNYNDYFETFKRDNVTLVDVNEAPIERFTRTGIQTSDTQYEHDSIVLATGFDAITGSFKGINIQGRKSITLEEKWDGRPRSYLGFSIDKFPNMWMISGPQNPSAITNQPVCIEQQVDWILNFVEYLDENNLRYAEASSESVSRWVEHTNEVAEKTLYPKADSWYRGDNIPGKSDVFLPYPGGFDNFRDHCDELAENDYEGYKMADSLEQLELQETEP